MKVDRLPNPALEGYRTAHGQDRDGSYKHFVVPTDLVPKKCNGSGCLGRIDRGGTHYEYGYEEDLGKDGTGLPTQTS